MEEMQACKAAEITRWGRLRWELNRKTWPFTSKVAYQIYRVTKWALEPKPKRCPKLLWRFLSGLAEGCWTHVCGHGPQFSFHMAVIYWWPRSMKPLAMSSTEENKSVG